MLGYDGPKPAVPTRFEHAMDAERGRWLRRRFLWYTGISFVLGIPLLLPLLFANAGQATFLLIASLITLSLTAAAFVYAWRSPPKKTVILRAAVWLYIILGLIGVVNTRISMLLGGFSQEVAAGAEVQDGMRQVWPEEMPTTRPLDEASQTALAALHTGLNELEDQLVVALAALPPLTDDPSHEAVVDMIDDWEDEVDDARSDLAWISSGMARDEFGIRITPGRVTINGVAVSPADASRIEARASAGLTVFAMFFFNHLLACLFIPWTARESLVPASFVFAGFVAVLAADVLLTGLWWWVALLFLALAVLAIVPGTAWCYLRDWRFPKWFRTAYESSRYRQLSGDLDGARKIHESALPEQQTDGPLRLSYVYEPMSQIGGDLLYVRRDEEGKGGDGLTAVLLDVTGHGIAAALTVNRLLGELDRTFAEFPDAGPGEVLRRVNEYVHLTLSPHGVYVTGLAVRLKCGEPGEGGANGVYANAGHPPSFLRRTGGDTEKLDPTTFMLGVMGNTEFDPVEREVRVAKGDVLLLYTDGAAEARNERGRIVGINGLCDWFDECEPPDGADGWPGQLLKRITRHRNTAPDDDTLIVAVYAAA